MITICLTIYVVLGLMFICSLALVASRSTPQNLSIHPMAQGQAQPDFNEANSLRRAA